MRSATLAARLELGLTPGRAGASPRVFAVVMAIG